MSADPAEGQFSSYGRVDPMGECILWKGVDPVGKLHTGITSLRLPMPLFFISWYLQLDMAPAVPVVMLVDDFDPNFGEKSRPQL